MSMNSPKLTKAQRRELAREQEAQRLAEAAEKARRTRRISLIGLVVGLVVIGGLVALIWSQATGRDAVPNFAAVPLNEVPHTPRTASTTDGGILFGRDLVAGEGENVGAPNIGIYLDYMCPACKAFEDANLPDIINMVQAGEANLVMHPVAIQDHASLGTAFSTRAVAAFAWLADRSPEHALAWHEAVFAQQPTQGTPGFTNADLASFARTVGVPDDIAAGIEDGTATETYGQWAASVTEYSATLEALTGDRGFGTPTITINGERWLGDWTAPGALREAVAAATATQ